MRESFFFVTGPVVRAPSRAAGGRNSRLVLSASFAGAPREEGVPEAAFDAGAGTSADGGEARSEIDGMGGL